MSEQIAKRKNWRDLYRLVILKEETLEEVNSYKLTLLNIYIAVSSILIVLAAILISIIFFTPIKKMVPGYGDPQENPAYMELYNRVQDMEKQLIAYDVYAENFKKLISRTDTARTIEQSDTHSQQNERPASLGSAHSLDPQSDSDWDNLSRASGRDPDIPDDPAISVSSDPKKTLDHLYLVPPLKGPISSHFDPEEKHYGIDILAPKDTPVKVILDGYVIASDWTLETGNTIGVQHQNNLVTFYKHNAVLLKKVGDYVPAGEAIALVGNTGKFSTGPHLHFELWQNGLPINPINYVNFD